MKYAWTMVLVLSALLAHAQTEGTIHYTEVRKLNFNGGNIPEEMLANLPKERTTHSELLFNEKGSLFRNAQVEEPQNFEHSTSSGGGEMQLQIKMATPENILYRNLAKETTVQQLEWMGERFLLSGNPEVAWKVTTEQRTIAGYPCMKATAERDSSTVEAWFTPQIPVSTGPDIYGGLPGLILELVMDEGNRRITATEITLAPLEEKLKEPRRGQKMTRADFEVFQAEKLEEMKAMRGEGGAVFIIREEG